MGGSFLTGFQHPENCVNALFLGAYGALRVFWCNATSKRALFPLSGSLFRVLFGRLFDRLGFAFVERRSWNETIYWSLEK